MAKTVVTAYLAADRAAVVAYATEWTRRGPNGEARQAFLLRSEDAGTSWSEVPLTRTIASHLRFWGYPTWPPESIAAVAQHGAALEIAFRDEWVPFEPGGESEWTAARSRDGLWSVRRVRRMDYEGADHPMPRPPVRLALPPGFAPPEPAMIERIAARIDRDEPFELPDWPTWVAGAVLVVMMVCGVPKWLVLGGCAGFLGCLAPFAFLAERRRVRAAVRSTAELGASHRADA